MEERYGEIDLSKYYFANLCKKYPTKYPVIELDQFKDYNFRIPYMYILGYFIEYLYDNKIFNFKDDRYIIHISHSDLTIPFDDDNKIYNILNPLIYKRVDIPGNFSKKFIDNYGDVYQLEWGCYDQPLPTNIIYNDKKIKFTGEFFNKFDSKIKLSNYFISKIKSGKMSSIEAKEMNKFENSKKETSSQEISQIKEDMNSLKEYCLELQKIGDDQQKILEEVCKENIEIKKELRELRKLKKASI